METPPGNSASRPIRIGISACLLGEAVRFDGGHKRDAFLTEGFGRFVEWVPVCPEVECGLGTPRESMRLVGTEDGVRLLTVRSAIDLTSRMVGFARARVAQLTSADLCGYVLKKDSPSCGLERVKIYTSSGNATRTGRGVFAAAILKRFPDLPIEEEGRLSDPRLRENFVERVFGYWRLRGLFATRWTVGSLVLFHTAHKLILMAHSPEIYRELGRLVANARSVPRSQLELRYTKAFMAALATQASPGRHANVLEHMAGYFTRRLDGKSRQELSDVIGDFRRGLVPLIVPITLVRHHVRVHSEAYLAEQIYLDPYPKALMLRNHV